MVMSQKPFMDPPEQESIPGTPPPPREYIDFGHAAEQHLPQDKTVTWRFTMWYDISPSDLMDTGDNGEEIMDKLREYGQVTIVKVEEIDA
jgi:hypothetical protein